MCVKAAADGKKVYFSTGRAGTVDVLDSSTEEVTKAIKVGTRPWGIAISPDGGFLFAANGPSDDVSVVDLNSEKEIARIKSAGSPWGIAISPNNERLLDCDALRVSRLKCPRSQHCWPGQFDRLLINRI